MTGSSRSLGEFTGTGVVRGTPTRLVAVEIITDGTNTADVIFHDSASAASGLKLFEGGAPGADRSKFVRFSPPLKADNGVYLTLTGTGASCIVYEG